MGAPPGNCFNPNGRPKKPIDWATFEKLCELQCTLEEVSDFLHVCKDTLIDRVQDQYKEDYSTIYKRYAVPGKCSLRRSQFAMSKKNAAMAIWLGKQYLGQKETLNDTIASDEVNSKYLDLMKQLLNLQSDRNIATNNNINEQKS